MCDASESPSCMFTKEIIPVWCLTFYEEFVKISAWQQLSNQLYRMPDHVKWQCGFCSIISFESWFLWIVSILEWTMCLVSQSHSPFCWCGIVMAMCDGVYCWLRPSQHERRAGRVLDSFWVSIREGRDIQYIFTKRYNIFSWKGKYSTTRQYYYQQKLLLNNNIEKIILSVLSLSYALLRLSSFVHSSNVLTQTKQCFYVEGVWLTWCHTYKGLN